MTFIQSLLKSVFARPNHGLRAGGDSNSQIESTHIVSNSLFGQIQLHRDGPIVQPLPYTTQDLAVANVEREKLRVAKKS